MKTLILVLIGSSGLVLRTCLDGIFSDLGKLLVRVDIAKPIG